MICPRCRSLSVRQRFADPAAESWWRQPGSWSCLTCGLRWRNPINRDLLRTLGLIFALFFAAALILAALEIL